MPSPNHPPAVPPAFRGGIRPLLDCLDAVFIGTDGRVTFEPAPLSAELNGLGEELVLLTGVAGGGKTDLILNMGLSMARHRHVVIASYEIARAACVRRILPAASCLIPGGTPLTEADFADESKREVVDDTVAAVRAISDNLIIVDDLTMDDVRGHSIECLTEAVHAIAIRDGIPPAVIVDYAQLVTVSTPAFSTTDILDRVSFGLAQMAHHERTPVIAVAITGKDGSFRGTAKLEFDADIILSIMTDREDAENGSRDLHVDIQKEPQRRRGRPRRPDVLACVPPFRRHRIAICGAQMRPAQPQGVSHEHHQEQQQDRPEGLRPSSCFRYR